MGLRKKPRVKMVVPVRIWGTDSAGNPFNILAYTLNVSTTGARLGGVKVPLGVGDAVTIQYKQQRALFKTAWLGQPGTPTQDQIGVALLEQDRQIWTELNDSRTYLDDFAGQRRTPPEPAKPAVPEPVPPAVEVKEIEIPVEIAEAAADIPPEPASPPATSEEAVRAIESGENFPDSDAMIRACARGLLHAEQAVKQDPPAAAALQEFRDALAKIRQTAWALQQWHEMKAEGKKAFPLLSYLNSERLRFVTQAAHDLAEDMEHKGVEVDPALLQTLFERVDRLRPDRKKPSEAFSIDVLAPGPASPASTAASMVSAMRAAALDVQRTGMGLEPACAFLSLELKRVLEADGVAIARIEGGEMVCAGSSGNAPEAGMVLDTDSGIGAEAMAHAELVYCADTQKDARVDAELCRAANIGAVVMAPILSSNGAKIGMIEICSARSNAFKEEHLQSMSRAAELIGKLLPNGASTP